MLLMEYQDYENDYHVFLEALKLFELKLDEAKVRLKALVDKVNDIGIIAGIIPI